MLVGIFWKAASERPTKDELEKAVNAALPHLRYWRRIKNWRKSPGKVLTAYEMEPTNLQPYESTCGNSLALAFQGSETDLVMFRLASPTVDYAIFKVADFAAWGAVIEHFTSFATELRWAECRSMDAIRSTISLPRWGGIASSVLLLQEEQEELEALIADLSQRVRERWSVAREMVLAAERKKRDELGRLITTSGTSTIDIVSVG